jgi:hypothetical protein
MLFSFCRELKIGFAALLLEDKSEILQYLQDDLDFGHSNFNTGYAIGGGIPSTTGGGGNGFSRLDTCKFSIL